MSSKRYEAERIDPAPLAQPLTFEFSGKTVKNRFLKSSMSERQSSWDATDLPKRGIPSKELINMYRKWGEGGYGVILVGNTMMEYDQLESPGNAIIPPEAPFSGERFEAFTEIAAASKKHGSCTYVQLSHPGRQATENVQPNPISASDVQLESGPFGMRFAKPRPMEKEDFEHVTGRFAQAAEYCYKAGFDGVELHAAHGYLLAQFLAPSTNKRTDEYGGSFLNRARIVFKVVEAIRERVPNKSFSIGIKVNSVEFQDGGFASEDCKALCVELEKHGLDWIELSGGTYERPAFEHKRESTRQREAFFIEFAEQIIPELTKTKVYVTGGLRTARGMVSALDSVHGVGIARPAAHEFDLPQQMLDGKVDSALRPLLDEADYAISNVAAGTQMQLVGRNSEPLDLSREDHKGVFMASMAKWLKTKTPDMVGFVEVDGIQLQPYGTPYTAAA